MNITKNTIVELKYQISTENGDILDPGTEPMAYLHGGYRGIFPKVEDALEGRFPGDEITVMLEPHDHYGEHDPELVHAVPREKLPPEIEEGLILEAHNEGTGESYLVTIIEINDTEATLDGNHPLAGKTLIFQARVESVREATAEEIAHGHAHGEHGAHH